MKKTSSTYKSDNNHIRRTEPIKTNLMYIYHRIYGIILYYCQQKVIIHYNDVIMTAMASQITDVLVVYWIVYSCTDQRNHQSSASLAFVKGIHWWPGNYLHKGPVTWEMFTFDDVVTITLKHRRPYISNIYLYLTSGCPSGRGNIFRVNGFGLGQVRVPIKLQTPKPTGDWCQIYSFILFCALHYGKAESPIEFYIATLYSRYQYHENMPCPIESPSD